MNADERTLLSPRLVLRPHRADDFPDVFALWSDPGVTRFIGGRASTREESWSRLLRYVGHWAVTGFGYWVVEERASGRFAGEVGFSDFHRTIEPPFGATPEAGWVVAPWAQGRGYAVEAVRTALAWADRHFLGERTVALIHPENAPSLKVADACGYREYARTLYAGQPAVLFERLR